MKLTIEMGPGYRQTVERLSSMGRHLQNACSDGLEKGVKIAAGNVVTEHLTGQDLKRRSGNLARSIDGWKESQTGGVVGVRDGSAVSKYAWLLSDDQHVITPKKGKYLTIPIGEGLTPSGVPRYKSPRDVEDGFFVKTKGQLLFGRKNGKRGKFRPLFTLVKSVLVQGTGSLYDGVMESMDDIARAIEKEIDRQLGAA